MMRQKMNLTTKNEVDQTSKDLRRIRPAPITVIQQTVTNPHDHQQTTQRTATCWCHTKLENTNY